jgi:hypothetical protein
MWFAKWFGGRKETPEDDEPARFSAPIRSEQPVVTTPRPSGKPGQAKGKGFDPYNSGSFERRNAWERINRR